MFPDNAEAHPLTRLVLVLATPQGAALMVTVFLLAVAMHIFSDQAQANLTEKHWDEVCRQVLRERDELDHDVLGGAAGDSSNAIQQVRCCLSLWGCRICPWPLGELFTQRLLSRGAAASGGKLRELERSYGA